MSGTGLARTGLPVNIVVTRSASNMLDGNSSSQRLAATIGGGAQHLQISDTLAYATAEKQGAGISYRGWDAAHEFILAQVSASARRSKMTPVFASVQAIRSSDQTCAASCLTLA